MNSVRTFLLATVVLAAAATGAEQRAAWHHGSSPYRAVLKITARPDLPEAGTAVNVPVCNTGLSDGEDLFAFDERGQSLPLLALGDSIRNSALAMVQVRAEIENIYVYFGSRMKAPQNRQLFKSGLTLDVRTFPSDKIDSWTDVKKTLDQSKRIARMMFPNISLSYNPADSTDIFASVFEGYLKIPTDGAYTYMLVSDDAGYLFIDDQLLIDRSGRHYAQDAVRGEARATVQLKAGLHRIQCIVVDAGGAQMAVVARWVHDRNKTVLQPAEFLQSGKTELINVEAKYRDADNPCFFYELVSTMNYEGVDLTEVKFSTFNNRPAQWRFSDGYRTESAAFSRLFTGLQTAEVAVSQGRAKARGTVQFPELFPPVFSVHNSGHYTRYSQLIAQQPPQHLDAATLLGYHHFLAYHELNADLAPVCAALIMRNDVPRPEKNRALLNYARVMSATDPAKAEKAYEELLSNLDKKPLQAHTLREIAEFALFAKRDNRLARKAIESLSKLLSSRERAAQLLHFQWLLQDGKVDDARRTLEQLLNDPDLVKKQLENAVKCNALRERYYDLLKSGFIADAKRTLWQWEDLAGADWTNGSLALARSRLWRRLGWLDGALTELDGAVILVPMLPNLPEVELERAEIFLKAGSRNKANEVLQRIAAEFPNHPAAARAEALIKNPGLVK